MISDCGKNQEINVYGIGINALKFMLRCGDEVTVKSFIEGRKVKQKFMDLDVPVIDVKEAEVYLKRYYTIVASSENVYFEIKETLESYGLKEFIDFEYHECFHKKLAILYGNCHGGVLKRYLSMSKEFSSQYGFYPVEQIQECAQYKKDNPNIKVYERYLEALHYCDLFIHQGVKKENYFGEEFSSDAFIKFLKPGCTKIVFPNLYRMPMFMFPQMVSYTDTVKWEGLGWFFKDKFIDENYTNMTISQLADMIENEDLLPQNEILHGIKDFEQKIYEREKNWDIKILNHIKNGYKKQKLFYDPGHPSGYIMTHVAKKILNILGFRNVPDLNFYTAAELDVYEIPLYGSVRKALCLQGGDNVIRRYNGVKLRNVPMDLEEYIQEYLFWNHNSIKEKISGGV